MRAWSRVWNSSLNQRSVWQLCSTWGGSNLWQVAHNVPAGWWRNLCLRIERRVSTVWARWRWHLCRWHLCLRCHFLSLSYKNCHLVFELSASLQNVSKLLNEIYFPRRSLKCSLQQLTSKHMCFARRPNSLTNVADILSALTLSCTVSQKLSAMQIHVLSASL